ncbi:MAG: DUF3997 domain-containing protein [Flavobacteriaceae bacterium]|nr:DUF3997 domain-containing protein [Flavobacteriaceae bacterium]
MKSLAKYALLSLLLFQSCYFGAGLVEENLTEDYSLFANNSMDEMSIWHHTAEYQNDLIVEETVFAVGYDDEFIIAKSHPKDSINRVNKKVTYYHIIKVDNNSKKEYTESTKLTSTQFEVRKRQLKVPNDLKFTKIFKELE